MRRPSVPCVAIMLPDAVLFQQLKNCSSDYRVLLDADAWIDAGESIGDALSNSGRPVEVDGEYLERVYCYPVSAQLKVNGMRPRSKRFRSTRSRETLAVVKHH